MWTEPPYCLRRLPFGARAAIALFLLVNLAGFVASAGHMRAHHRNRDGSPEMTLTDIEGAYHGVKSPAPLSVALKRGHPANLDIQGPSEAELEALESWLAGDKIIENWDNMDLGDMAPAEILDVNCVVCHSRNAPEEKRTEPYLERPDDIRTAATSKDVSPTDSEILLMSTHTHAIAMATIGLLLALLTCCTRWPRSLVALLTLITAVGLSVDLAAWWIAREVAGLAPVIVAGGLAYGGGVVLMSVAILFELFGPAVRD